MGWLGLGVVEPPRLQDTECTERRPTGQRKRKAVAEGRDWETLTMTAREALGITWDFMPLTEELGCKSHGLHTRKLHLLNVCWCEAVQQCKGDIPSCRDLEVKDAAIHEDMFDALSPTFKCYLNINVDRAGKWMVGTEKISTLTQNTELYWLKHQTIVTGRDKVQSPPDGIQRRCL